MSRPIRLTVTATGATAAIPLNTQVTPFNATVAITLVGASTGTFTVQHTVDDIFDASVTPVWLDHSDIASDTANVAGNYAFPVTAVRLSVAALSGSLKFTVIQAGVL